VPASGRIEQIEQGLVSPNSRLSARGCRRPFTWVLARMGEPLLQGPVPLGDEHLGPLGRGDLLTSLQPSQQGLLPAQPRPLQAIALGLS
jgi:hypothetical protein